MSGDNGIYIGAFPSRRTGGPTEYRVAHAQALENCDDDTWGRDGQGADAQRVLYYGDSAVYLDKDSADRRAVNLEKEIRYTEYGICHIDYDRPFPKMTKEEANEFINDYWEELEKLKLVKEVVEG